MADDSGLLKRRVLIVDDDAMVADTLAMVVSGWGYETVAVYGPERALRVAPEFLPDVLVTDVEMHPLDGIQLASRLAGWFPRLRVVFITGSIAPDPDCCRFNGYPAAVLSKPFHPPALRPFLE